MCGIAGGWMTGLDDEMLSRALDAIAHRGPDGRGAYCNGAGVALGHVRLAIIDLSPTGAQPMYSDDGQVVLTFNGEIYNFAELRKSLEATGTKFIGQSDTEVLLRLYLAKGMDMLPMLNGIFAFAIYDKRSNELLLARDGFGIKPIYYCANSDGFAFASELKGLLKLMPAGHELDPASLDRYLTYLWCPGDGTPFEDVRRLKPGHAMRVRDGKMEEMWQWYGLPITRPAQNRFSDLDTAVDAVRAGLRLAVERQLVADVPVGAMLSGGLDSSAIVAFARERVDEMKCFTIEAAEGEDAGVSPDLPYAQRVAKHLGVELEIVRIDADRMIGDLERMVWQLDEPLADPASLNANYICEQSRQSGIKVLLSGAGGDDLFTGYSRHLALRLESLWSWLPASMRGGIENATGLLDPRKAIGRRARRLFLDAHLSGDARLAAYFAWARRSDLEPLYTRRFKDKLGSTRADQPMLDFLAGARPDATRLDRMLGLEQRFFLADHNLTYTDKMSMAAGVEVRVPFLDPELVEIAARIPDRFRQKGKEGKWILKKAMEPYLPHDVIYRPKSGFGAPLRRWMTGEFKPLLADLLSEQSVRKRGLFEPQAVRQMIERNEAGKGEFAYTIFSLLCIEIWCRRFLDGAQASSAQLIAAGA